MKKYFLIVGLLISAQIGKAQICGLNNSIPHATVAYVFSDRNDLSMEQIFGEKVHPAFVSIIRIKTPEQKKEIERLILKGEAVGVFIFPGNTERETKRYCSAKDYAETIKKENEK